ncbi:MAG: glycerol-3-phosphate acyltransferase [Oscillospiraceae bacterium]
MIITVMLIVIAAISYCLGNANGAILTSTYIFHKDIRNMGSGNAGLTNFYRNFGSKGIAMVMGIDIFKGIVTALLGGWLLGLTAGDYAGPVDFVVVGELFATFCLIIGHIYPVFYEFRGGKGVLSGVAAAFVVDWRAAMICLVVFAVLFIAFKYVSLGAVVGALSFPLSVTAMGYGGLAAALASLSVLVIVFNHRTNIMRLINHKEPKFELKKNVARKLDDDNF